MVKKGTKMVNKGDKSGEKCWGQEPFKYTILSA